MNITEYIKIENLNILQFEKIKMILNDKTKQDNAFTLLNKIIEILEYLKVDDEIIDSITAKDVADFVNYYRNDKYEFDLENVTTEIEIKGRKYVCEEGLNVEIKGRMLGKLFSEMTNENFDSYLLALIFKDVDLTDNEHKDEAHIRYKQSLFKELRYVDYAPYIIKISNDIITANVSIVKNSNTTNELE